MTGLFVRFRTLRELFEPADIEPWDYTEEPHSQRRKAILRKHPEIKQLMGYNTAIVWIVTTEVLIQLVMCWLSRDLGWFPLVLLSYAVGGTLNHSLGSAIHEIGHNLAYGHCRPLYNRALGMMCNLPMGIPLSVSYKKYHADHHLYLGNLNLDADIPMRLECILFRHPLSRVIWLLIHPLIHGLRPFLKNPKPVSGLEVINLVVQFLFDFMVLIFLGKKSLIYLIAGTVFGLGLHPLAGHFISEHYMFKKGQATLSYYGPLNSILFNVGYHIEHHDFPYIAWNKLPDVKRMAPEFYDHLPHHTSLLKVLFKFITDTDMGPQGHGIGYFKSDLEEMSRIAKMDSAEVNSMKQASALTKVPNGKSLVENASPFEGQIELLEVKLRASSKVMNGSRNVNCSLR